jgi:hypothetical protein
MAAEIGHLANRVYIDQQGDLHLNNAILWDQGELAVAQKLVFSQAIGADDVVNVTIQVQDGQGNNLGRNFEMLVYLSDSPIGDGLTATTASGTVGAGSSGTDLSAKQAKKAIDVLTDATGKYILSINDTAETPFVVCAICPGTGNLFVMGPALVYG